MASQDSRSARLNMRLTADAKSDLVQAASLTGQDLTSFVLNAALEKSRAVVLESTLIRLPSEQYEQLVEALDRSGVASPGLQKLFNRVGDSAATSAIR